MEERRGRITRISGSLVVAEGIPKPQMYEVAEVGEQRLVGEIVRIDGDRSYIQVYESTSGLRPGEPVYGTGSPLSVELGPGLVGQIFDGIQRPLKRIADIAKSIFVARGIRLEAVPRDRKYFFTPSKEFRPGDKVEPGDVIGYVEETPLIRNAIMIPHGVRGRIIEIASEGEYTVEDHIAYVEENGEKRAVKMLSRWPARKPRPFKEKLEPELPMLTGMRIIDTLFPMAKGGTGAIPGGFGTGKCVPPNTPILLASGELVTIKELYERVRDKGVIVESSEEEELIDISSLGLRILTFNGIRLREAPVNYIYKGKSRYMVRIRTRSGRVIEVTPPHRLLKLSEEGYIVETPAAELRRGDQLVIPRYLPIEGKPQLLDPYELGLDDATVGDEEDLKRIQELIRVLVYRLGGYKRASETLGINEKTLKQIVKGKTRPRLGLVRRVCALLGVEPLRPRILGLPRSGISVRVPEHLDEDLAELLGLVISDGMVTDRTVRFFSNSEELRARFKELVYRVFGVMARDESFRTVKGVIVNSKLVARILRALGVPSRRKSQEAVVPHLILRSPINVVKAFLRGYYLGDGSFARNEVEITTASKWVAVGLAYLLARLGIIYTIREKRVYGRIYYRIIITSRDEIEKFLEAISAEWTMGLSKILRIALYISSKRQDRKVRDAVRIEPQVIPGAVLAVSKRILEQARINTKNYAIVGERVGAAKLMLLAQLTEDSVLRSIAGALKYVAFDEVESIEVIEGDFNVYDVTVPGTHNFVGGEVPAILHNTVTLHSLAMWSDARVVIYIGCGERGNEMTEVLEKFPTYKDPWSGRPLMERTILIANTSNMPVSAREASIYVGVTMAEYYRDMGYDVLLVADSTSRWAEALREIAGRLEEMPAEEGYPSYLQSRLAEFYERAGRVVTLGRPERVGSVTLVGAVSPPGADFTEPVTTHTRRFIRVFWALDTALAYSRHYPAINWITSYSAYVDTVTGWWANNVAKDWRDLRDTIYAILQRENELREIVRLIGPENLAEPDKLVMDIARIIREGFLKQNAYDRIDAFASPQKQVMLMRAIVSLYRSAKKLVDSGVSVKTIREKTQDLVTELIKARFTVSNEELNKLEELEKRILDRLGSIAGGS
ncbi:MAG: V-type ATP synthase subunit A [Desulfurococcales archaeon]|nr:V-type ATP synthase subunit A [Desulfurococcales archaeon]